MLKERPHLIEAIGLVLSVTLAIVLTLLGEPPASSLAYSFMLQLVFEFVSIRIQLGTIREAMGFGHGVSSAMGVYRAFHDARLEGDKHVQPLVVHLAEGLNARAADLQQKRVELSPGEFMIFAKRLFDGLGAGDQLVAISLWGGGEYWSKKYGERYLKLNKEAADRGCEITRVFVPSDTQGEDEVTKLIGAQSSFARIGVATFRDIEEIDPRAARDFFIVNSSFVAEWVFDRERRDIERVTLVFSKVEVERYMGYKRDVMEAAKFPAPPPATARPRRQPRLQ